MEYAGLTIKDSSPIYTPLPGLQRQCSKRIPLLLCLNCSIRVNRSCFVLTAYRCCFVWTAGLPCPLYHFTLYLASLLSYSSSARLRRNGRPAGHRVPARSGAVYARVQPLARERALPWRCSVTVYTFFCVTNHISCGGAQLSQTEEADSSLYIIVLYNFYYQAMYLKIHFL